jgi:hypothetical protein
MYQYRFTFLCTKEEKSYLRKLAAYYHRSQSDVIRLLVRDAMTDLSSNLDNEKKNHEGKENEHSSIES